MAKMCIYSRVKCNKYKAEVFHDIPIKYTWFLLYWSFTLETTLKYILIKIDEKIGEKNGA